MSKQKTIALIDGDIVAVMAAMMAEYVHHFDTTYHLMADMEEAQRHVRNKIEEMRQEVKAQKVVVVLSCKSRRYWRHDLNPDYKGNRKSVRGPICLGDLKEWMIEHYDAVRWDNYEADDVLGVLATDPEFHPESRKVVVSIDKDMQTIPGAWIFNPDKDYQPWLNAPLDAEFFHLTQLIGGDSTDGYSGVRGMSPESAAAFLKSPWCWESYEHTFKTGKRAGQTELRWRKCVSTPDIWTCIVSLFTKAGQTEEEAILNGRMAKLTTHHEFKPQCPTLWEPSDIKGIYVD